MDFAAQLAALKATFQGELQGKLAELRAAIGDREKARRLAHKLAGSSGSYGYAALSEALRALEAALATDEHVDDLLARVEASA